MKSVSLSDSSIPLLIFGISPHRYAFDNIAGERERFAKGAVHVIVGDAPYGALRRKRFRGLHKMLLSINTSKRRTRLIASSALLNLEICRTNQSKASSHLVGRWLSSFSSHIYMNSGSSAFT